MARLFDLDLTKYNQYDKDEEYPLRENYANWLMTPGVFADGDKFTTAVTVMDMLTMVQRDRLVLNEEEVAVLKEAINRLLEATQRGQAALGGRLHAEAITRIFNIKEIEQKE